ncbi:MAG: FadR/GntR family transcriptional regulator [Aestuariivirga sp.]
MSDASVTPLNSLRASMRRANLHDHIVDALGVRIVSGKFPQDEVLPNEATLASELGVSRNALREAIKVLERKGLVEVRTKTGTRVLPRGEWSLLDKDVLGWVNESGQELQHAMGLVEFRLIFEPKASYLAALRATDAELKMILSTCDDLEACVGKSLLVMSEMDLIFHRAILQASHNDVLMHLGSLIVALMKIQVVATSWDQKALVRGLKQHRALAEAIAKREAAKAMQISHELVLAPYNFLANSNGVATKFRLK